MLRYRACVVALSCTCTSSHRSAQTPTVTFPARGSTYEPVQLARLDLRESPLGVALESECLGAFPAGLRIDVAQAPEHGARRSVLVHALSLLHMCHGRFTFLLSRAWGHVRLATDKYRASSVVWQSPESVETCNCGSPLAGTPLGCPGASPESG